jgi:hypothetical protein
VQLGGHLRRAGLITLALLAGSLGCRHRGGAWEAAAVTALEPSGDVELFVLGQTRANHATVAVAGELDTWLTAALVAGRPTVIVGLGGDLGAPGPDRSGRCAADPTPFAGADELARVIARAVEAGASSWGLLGPDAWRCLGPLAAREAVGGPSVRPGPAYLVRVTTAGTAELGSRCTIARCELIPSEAPARLELVFLDLSAWVYPELADPESTAAVLEQQRSLLVALAGQARVPRLLISPIPIESAGTHGLGGRKQRTSFRYLPEFLRDAIAAGLFAGAIGALERDLQISADLSNAIVRGDRSFIDRPIFEVVSGAAGGASHTLPTSRGGALLPDLWSEHTGFVQLVIGRDDVELVAHARVGGRWQRASVRVPLDPTERSPLREAPTIQPCPSCDPQQGIGDTEVFVPRVDRPR